MIQFIKDNSIMIVSSALLVGLVGGASALENAKEDSNLKISNSVLATTTAAGSSENVGAKSNGTGETVHSSQSAAQPTTTEVTPATQPSALPTITTKPSISGRGQEDDD